jgi:hypothetical protein
MNHIKKRKNKDHAIISMDAEKTFHKRQYPCMIKILIKLRMEGIYLNIVEATYKKACCDQYS